MMKKNAKKIALALASCAVFAAYFVLSLSCATTSGTKRNAGTEVSVSPSTTKNEWNDYDITLVSAENCPSRILKWVKKDSATALVEDEESEEDEESTENAEPKVFYTISATTDTKVLQSVKTANGTSTKEVDYNLVTASEVGGKYLIEEKDAKAAIEFINELEKNFKAERTGEGVLHKFEIKNTWTEHKVETERVVKSTSNVGAYYENHYEDKLIEYDIPHEERVFFIQHSTSFGKDEILYSAGRVSYKDSYGNVYVYSPTPVVVSLEEILAVRDALSK